VNKFTGLSTPPISQLVAAQQVFLDALVILSSQEIRLASMRSLGEEGAEGGIYIYVCVCVQQIMFVGIYFNVLFVF
jgi:hypothetical protein